MDGQDDQMAGQSFWPPVDSLELVLSSRAKMESLGRVIGRAVSGGEILALIGPLGVGKTTLVRGIAAGLGVSSDLVSSPTFVLAHEYRTSLSLFHLDLYRLKTAQEADAMGLHDYFTAHSVAAIEWADRFPDLLPADRLEVRFAHRSPSTRNARLTALGPQSSMLLSRIALLLQRRRRSSTLGERKDAGRRKAPTR
jgi:tRNA threonylcarbamoyladenosine biosynthesis protein TsaE